MSIGVKNKGGGSAKQEKTVTAGTAPIEVTPDKGKLLSKVTVNPTPTEQKTVTPGAAAQTVLPATGKHLSRVTVKGDSDLIPENIKVGANIFGTEGTFGGVPIEYSFTGQSQLTYDEVTVNRARVLAFTLKLLTSGTLNIKQLGVPHIDVYVIGGGGGGGSCTGAYYGGGGGAGAYMNSEINVDIQKNTDYPVVIGAGGVGGVYSSSSSATAGGTGGQSSAFGITANGGSGGDSYASNGGNAKGGDGGTGGGAGAYMKNVARGGTGDGKSKTVLGKVYAGGGNGGDYSTNGCLGGYNGSNGTTKFSVDSSFPHAGTEAGGATYGANATPNMGGGGGGANARGGNGGAGGSGIVIIRGRY